MVVIPTNEPVVRIDHPDIIYKTEAAKFRAIVSKVKQLQDKGQPVLIGTASIEKNENLSKLLTKAGIKHQVLNAKNNAKEALIVAQAGQKRAVTLATNIAGRGTDIVLGEGVVKLGGLFVLGTERHEARRIDNQLRGRSGRQGDPGESQFYVSTEDDLMRIFGGDRIAKLLSLMGRSEDQQMIQNRSLTKALSNAQKSSEGRNFDARKYVVQYDDVMNKHRLITYKVRRQLLEEVAVSDQIKDFITDEVNYLASLPGQDDTYERLIVEVFPLDDQTLDNLFEAVAEEFKPTLRDEALKIYDNQRQTFGEDVFEKIERDAYFQTLDNLWMYHLEQMEHMQQGVQWMSVGQKDPLIEYRRQAQILYSEMQSNLRRTILKVLMHAQPVSLSSAETETDLTRAARQSVARADQVTTAQVLDEDDFSDSEAGENSNLVSIKTKNQQMARKKKRKQERQNRKKGRK